MRELEAGLFVLAAGFVINIIFAEKKQKKAKAKRNLSNKNKLYKLYKPLGGKK